MLLKISLFAAMTFAVGCGAQNSSELQSEKADPQDLANLEIDSAFRTESGKLLVKFEYFSSFSDVKPAVPSWIAARDFWGDEKGLVKLNSEGFGGTSVKYGQTFTDPNSPDGEVRVERAGASMRMLVEGKEVAALKLLGADETAKLLENIKSGKIALSEGPQYRDVEYLFAREDGQFILVDAPAPDFSYDFNVYTGTSDTLEKVEVEGVQRYRDGGTTLIALKDGSRIFSPVQGDPIYTTADGKELSLERLNWKDHADKFVSIKDRYVEKHVSILADL